MQATVSSSLAALPNEVWLLVFSHLTRAEQTVAARCSKPWRILLRPLIWQRVDGPVSWKIAKTVCFAIRRDAYLASCVRHWALSIGIPYNDNFTRVDELEVIPLFVSTLRRLVNLRTLDFTQTVITLQSGMLDHCVFPRLESLIISIGPVTASFIARQPTIKSLSAYQRPSEDFWPRLGQGVPLEYLSITIRPFLQLLEHHANGDLSVRQLAPACTICIPNEYREDWVAYARRFCELVNGTGLRLAELCLPTPEYALGSTPIPSDARTSGVQMVFFSALQFMPEHEPTVAHVAKVLSIFPALHTLKYAWYSPVHEPAIGAADAALNRFSATCMTLRTVMMGSIPVWERRGGVWARVRDEDRDGSHV
ncbi:hypothetical protein EXIGLDRAFT_834303 [Exidia glandulosa HHB12029]|uniref:F-box domain-containing protein n=1 Tax=Exidia glandulosa HHB12029 TaxID=1314781 RepID=A0A166AV88_EXIGL|nr:hypothetical protein EXIGLDRAFT_834303 [Exidia glandulosa HHB12029]